MSSALENILSQHEVGEQCLIFMQEQKTSHHTVGLATYAMIHTNTALHISELQLKISLLFTKVVNNDIVSITVLNVFSKKKASHLIFFPFFF